MSNYKHGMKRTKIYGVWSAMVARCHNPNTKAYPNYGGRGITVCDQWRSFSCFYADMGDRPEGKTLERIENNKGYSPKNCKWAGRREQSRNRRGLNMVTVEGVSRSLGEWSEIKGISIPTLWARLNNNWTPKEAITTPLVTKRKGIRRGERLRDHI